MADLVLIKRVETLEKERRPSTIYSFYSTEALTLFYKYSHSIGLSETKIYPKGTILCDKIKVLD